MVVYWYFQLILNFMLNQENKLTGVFCADNWMFQDDHRRLFVDGATLVQSCWI